MVERTYVVEGMSCQHCVEAVRGEVGRVDGVTAVHVDLSSKQVVVQGDDLDDAAVRAAIVEAGYEAAP